MLAEGLKRVLLVLFFEIDYPNYRNRRYKGEHNQCSHNDYSLSFVPRTSQSPESSVIIMAILPPMYIIHFCWMSPKMDVSITAVVMYLAMSISYLPNSFFMVQRYEIKFEVQSVKFKVKWEGRFNVRRVMCNV